MELEYNIGISFYEMRISIRSGIFFLAFLSLARAALSAFAVGPLFSKMGVTFLVFASWLPGLGSQARKHTAWVAADHACVGVTVFRKHSGCSGDRASLPNHGMRRHPSFSSSARGVECWEHSRSCRLASMEWSEIQSKPPHAHRPVPSCQTTQRPSQNPECDPQHRNSPLCLRTYN